MHNSYTYICMYDQQGWKGRELNNWNFFYIYARSYQHMSYLNKVYFVDSGDSSTFRASPTRVRMLPRILFYFSDLDLRFLFIDSRFLGVIFLRFFLVSEIGVGSQSIHHRKSCSFICNYIWNMCIEKCKSFSRKY